MGPRRRWFLWRFVVPALSIPFALCIFIHDRGPGTYPFGLFALAGVSLMMGMAVWFNRPPDGDRGRAGTQPMGPRTPYEWGREHNMAKQNELNRMGLSGYWVDRRYFGRSRGPEDRPRSPERSLDRHRRWVSSLAEFDTVFVRTGPSRMRALVSLPLLGPVLTLPLPSGPMPDGEHGPPPGLMTCRQMPFTPLSAG